MSSSTGGVDGVGGATKFCKIMSSMCFSMSMNIYIQFFLTINHYCKRHRIQTSLKNSAFTYHYGHFCFNEYNNGKKPIL